MQDGIGSLRGVADHSAAVLWSGSPAPYGGYFDETGTRQTHYGFTGEPTDSNGLPYLRARYYDPAAGVFMALDPFEGTFNRPMSLNGYSWVEGNTPNMADPSGKFAVPGLVCLPSLVQVTLEDPFIQAKCGCYKHVDFAYNACVSSITNPSLVSGLSYCDGTRPGNIGCCGSDVTEWLYREMINHRAYAAGEFLRTPLPSWMEKLARTVSIFIAEVEAIALSVYGLALYYKRIDFQRLERASAIFWWARYSTTNIVMC